VSFLAPTCIALGVRGRQAHAAGNLAHLVFSQQICSFGPVRLIPILYGGTSTGPRMEWRGCKVSRGGWKARAVLQGRDGRQAPNAGVVATG